MEIILLLAGGLGLFLYAINNLSSILKDLLGERARKLLGKFTHNLFTGILSGIIITLILDSSSAVIIMTIILVNSGALTFRQAIGIVMGANIGTTFSSQLIALDIGRFSPIPIFLGLVLTMVAKSDRFSKTGKVILYFGILFFGLFTMETAVEPLRSDSRFASWMFQLENPVRGSMVGALVTLIIQSSSATVGMVITLAKKGLITLAGSIAVMLGAELGTCSDTLLATIRGSRQAIRTGLFHLVFNVTSIIIGLACFPLYVNLIESISGNATLEQKVANAHMLFNAFGVVLFLPLTRYVERLLVKWIPDKVTVSRKSGVHKMKTAHPEL
jgi:phosphate:Na+ symporter